MNDVGSATTSNNYTNGQVGQFVNAGAAQGQVSDGITDARSVTTTFVPNVYGYITTIVDGNGKTTTIQRDILGNPILITRPDNTTVKLAYDPNTHDLLSQTDSGTGITTSQTYDVFGNVLAVKNGRGFTYTKQYDPNTGLLVSTADPLGHGMSYRYNQFGLVTSAKNSLGIGVTTTYDSRGNPLAITDSANRSIISTYDGAGNPLTVKDANGNVSSYTYDAFNRLTSVTSPKGEATQYSYLPSGELAQIKDSLGNVTGFVYNLAGQMIQKTDPLGFVTRRSYDGNGNLIQELDPNGNVKNYVYDNLNHLIQKQLPDNLVSLAYDVRGGLIQASNNQASIVLAYDDAKRLTSVRTQGVGNSILPSVVISFAYDASNNRASMTDPTGTTNYVYDQGDRLISLSNPNGEIFSFGLDAANRMTGISRPGSSTQIAFDNANFVASIIHSAGGSTIAGYLYQRDPNGGVTGIQLASGISRNLSYDADSRLTQATNPEAPQPVMQTETFTYDSIGNRIQDQGGSFNFGQSSQRIARDYRYTYVFDNNGNLISKQEIGVGVGTTGFIGEVTNYSYSSENQLLGFKVYPAGSSSPSKIVSYSYDVLGRRIQKVVRDNMAIADPTKTFTHNFVYDGSEILLEYDGNNNLLARYTHSGLASDDVLAVNVTGAGVTAGVAKTSGSYMYLKDQIGTITDVADTNGNLVQHYIYSAFGELLGIKDTQANDVTASPPLNTSYTFTGREYDRESALYYYRARMYDPTTGRFMQKDPNPGKLKLPGSVVNSYVYTANSPLDFRDPAGQSIFGSIVLGLTFAGLAAATIATGGLAGILVGALAAGALSATITSIRGGSDALIAQSFLSGAIIGAAIGLTGFGAGALLGKGFGVAVGIGLGASIGGYAGYVAAGPGGAFAGVFLGGLSGGLAAGEGAAALQGASAYSGLQGQAQTPNLFSDPSGSTIIPDPRPN